MQLKRIVASDTRSANEQATALYGSDVLIISNNRVNGQVELVVAVDVPELGASSSKKEPIKPVGAGFETHMNLFELQSHVRTQIPKMSLNVLSSEKKLSIEQAPLVNEEKQALEYEQRDRQRNKELLTLIREEIGALRREFSAQKIQTQNIASLSLKQEIRDLLTELSDQGMSASMCQTFISDLQDVQTTGEALCLIRTKLKLNLPKIVLPAQGVHLIAGPSGSGKTLMIAKLANKLGIDLGPGQVAVISYKDTRVGAWSQVQMLCAQAGVDCFRANNPETLGLLLADISPRKLVLIDTAGVTMMPNIQEVLIVVPSCVCHAVVAADASLLTLNRLLNIGDLNWESLMISKLDESIRPWPLIEYLSGKQIGISAVGDGPEVHHMNKTFKFEDVVDKVLGSLEEEHSGDNLNFIKSELNFSAHATH